MRGAASYIRANVLKVRDNIAKAAARSGRSPEEIQLVAVTKSVGLPEIEVLYDLGVRHFGENRVEDARTKISQFQYSDAVWHMIGTLQSRKVREVLRLFDIVDAVDRIRIAQEIEKHAANTGAVFPVLVEVNVSGEETKHGFTPADLPQVLDVIRDLPHLRVHGLMTMAPLTRDPEDVRPFFARLRELGEEYGLRELSMGMSNDYAIAIEEGATQVRIGTALFECSDA